MSEIIETQEEVLAPVVPPELRAASLAREIRNQPTMIDAIRLIAPDATEPQLKAIQNGLLKTEAGSAIGTIKQLAHAIAEYPIERTEGSDAAGGIIHKEFPAFTEDDFDGDGLSRKGIEKIADLSATVRTSKTHHSVDDH